MSFLIKQRILEKNVGSLTKCGLKKWIILACLNILNSSARWKQQIAILLFKIFPKFAKLFLMFSSRFTSFLQIEISIKEQEFIWKLKNVTSVWFYTLHELSLIFFFLEYAEKRSARSWRVLIMLLWIQQNSVLLKSIGPQHTSSEACASEFAASGSEYSGFCKLFYTVAESFLWRKPWHNIWFWYVSYMIHFPPSSLFVLYFISEFLSCWVSNSPKRYKKGFLKTLCIP